MHIGIDCRLPFYRFGGISRYVMNLLPALAALDSENQYTIFHACEDRQLHLPPNGPNFQRRDLRTPCHHPLERLTLAVELAPYQLDVFHSPDFIPPSRGAQRRIITVHDLSFLHSPRHLTSESRRYYLDHIAWAVSVADHIAADSHHTREDLIHSLHVGPGKVSTIHLAADPLFTRPPSDAAVHQTLTRYDLPAGFILFAGTLEPRKNLPMLVRAYAALRRETGVIAPLVIVGRRGWLDQDIFATIDAEGVHAHVRHLGAVSDDELAHLYTAAGLLALPSHDEGFGLPALEAMHCGCQVVASRRASFPEVVGDAGLLVDPDDERAWVDAMTRVLKDGELRQRLKAAGRARARRFTWEDTAAATLNLYRGLA